MTVELSTFAKSLTAETAFTVLATAKQLQAAGKDVVELEIGDSPFDASAPAKAAGIEAIEQNHSHYCPSPGLPNFRDAAARMVRDEFGVPAERENVVVAPGAKIFEQFFCEAFLNPGDGVLVFSPYFPTYVPNIERRGGRPVFAPLRQASDFRPDTADIELFLAEDPSPKAIFLNSPHNPTGGVATEEDLRRIADLIRGEQIAVFSDEPYCHMVWRGRHHSLMAQPGMLDQGVAAYTFSKSHSMSGWRLGFTVSSPTTAESMSTMVNTTLSCTPPFVQIAGQAALEMDRAERDAVMDKFSGKVSLLTEGLSRLDGFRTLEPHATFYVFFGRVERLQSAGHHQPRSGPLSAGRGRRPVWCGVSGWRVFRRRRGRLPEVQLRGVRRAAPAGAGLHSEGVEPGEQSPRVSRVPA